MDLQNLQTRQDLACGSVPDDLLDPTIRARRPSRGDEEGHHGHGGGREGRDGLAREAGRGGNDDERPSRHGESRQLPHHARSNLARRVLALNGDLQLQSGLLALGPARQTWQGRDSPMTPKIDAPIVCTTRPMQVKMERLEGLQHGVLIQSPFKDGARPIKVGEGGIVDELFQRLVISSDTETGFPARRSRQETPENHVLCYSLDSEIKYIFLLFCT